MRGDFKIISLGFLLLILFAGQVSAYESFFVIKEDIDSKKAVLLYNIDPEQIMSKYDSIISLTKNEGDFSDLVRYLKSSKIMNVVYYDNDDIGNEIIQELKIQAGVSFRKLDGKDLIKLNTNSLENTPETEEANVIITGKAVSGQETPANKFLLIFFIIILIVIMGVILLIPKKKGKLKNK